MPRISPFCHAIDFFLLIILFLFIIILLISASKVNGLASMYICSFNAVEDNTIPHFSSHNLLLTFLESSSVHDCYKGTSAICNGLWNIWTRIKITIKEHKMWKIYFLEIIKIRTWKVQIYWYKTSLSSLWTFLVMSLNL